MDRPIGFDDTVGSAAQREMVLQLLDTYQEFIQEKLGKNLDAELSEVFNKILELFGLMRHKIETSEPDKLGQIQDAIASMICAMLNRMADINGDKSLKAMVANYELNNDLAELRPRSELSVKPTLH